MKPKSTHKKARETKKNTNHGTTELLGKQQQNTQDAAHKTEKHQKTRKTY